MGLDIYFYKVKKQREQIGYFRKVNFLVSYFNKSKIKDEIKITKKEVEELLEICNIVLKYHKENPDSEVVPSRLLPTQDGFFFGYTDYGKYYYEDVSAVKEYIENELLRQFDNLQDDECIEFYISY